MKILQNLVISCSCLIIQIISINISHLFKTISIQLSDEAFSFVGFEKGGNHDSGELVGVSDDEGIAIV